MESECAEGDELLAPCLCRGSSKPGPYTEGHVALRHSLREPSCVPTAIPVGTESFDSEVTRRVIGDMPHLQLQVCAQKLPGATARVKMPPCVASACDIGQGLDRWRIGGFDPRTATWPFWERAPSRPRPFHQWPRFRLTTHAPKLESVSVFLYACKNAIW